MGTNENSAASVNRERDEIIRELIEVPCIGDKVAEVMYEISIRSYRDLAQFLDQYTAEEISLTLKKHGVDREPGHIDKEKMEEWVSEKLSQQDQANTKLSKNQAETSKIPDEIQNNQKSKDIEVIFKVTFNMTKDESGNPILHTTEVYHEGDGGEEEQFQGSDTSQWVIFMLERAYEYFLKSEMHEAEIEEFEVPPQTEIFNTFPNPPTEPYDAEIIVDSVRLSVVENSIQLPVKKLKAEINFHLSGAEAVEITLLSLGYRVNISTEKKKTGTSTLLASDDFKLEPLKLKDYKEELEFAMPAVGIYYLNCVVKLPPSGQLVGTHQQTIHIKP